MSYSFRFPFSIFMYQAPLKPSGQPRWYEVLRADDRNWAEYVAGLCWLLGISDLKSGFSQNLKGEIDPVLPIYPLFTDRSLTLNQDGVCALTESASGTSTPSRAGFFPLGKQKEKTECPKASYSVSAPFGMGLREALHRFFALWQFQRNVHRITHQAMSTHAL